MNQFPNFRATVDPTPHSRPPVVRVCGELDAAHTAALSRAAGVTRGQDLVLDLTQLSFIDAAGLGCVVALRSERLQQGRSATIYAANRRVTRVFAIAGLDGLLEPAHPPDPGTVALEPLARPTARPRPATGPPLEGRLLWQSALFTLQAAVSFGRSVHVTASGHFGGHAATTVLRGAVARLAMFDLPIVIDVHGVVTTSGTAAQIFRSYVERGSSAA